MSPYRQTTRRAALALLGGTALMSPALQALAEPPAVADLAPADLKLLNRLTFGVNVAGAAEFASLGRRRWIDRQLSPPADDRLPPSIQAEIDALSITHTPMRILDLQIQQMNRDSNAIKDADAKAVARKAYQERLNTLSREAQTRSILRDIYSPDQLKEQLTWFWVNHFSVHAAKNDLRTMVGDYEDHAIRPRVLGSFRDLLGAVLHHPAMLIYLDNSQNAIGHINENYAREIMELHTMGVGSGYTQADVQELARILSGVGVNRTERTPHFASRVDDFYLREGMFEFNPMRHDFGPKRFLGRNIRGRGFPEVEEALDMLCAHPATARHVCTRLALYFVSDAPSDALVGAMAKTFSSKHGVIAEVMRTMIDHPDFTASLGGKFKDPVHFVVSALRLGDEDRPIENTRPVQNWINRLGEGLFNHETPDGYSLIATGWNGPGQIATRFEVARQMAGGPGALFVPEPPPPPPAPPQPAAPAKDMEGMAAMNTPAPPTPAPPTPAPKPPGPKPYPLPLKQNVAALGLDRLLGANTAAALAQAVSPPDWNTLFLCSPEFMNR